MLGAARLSSVSSLAMAAAGQAPSAATIEAAVASVTRLTDPPRFVLGSKSASRRAILEAATVGVPFDVVVPDIDEKAIGDRARDQPLALVSQIALAKADALLLSVTNDYHPGGCHRRPRRHHRRPRPRRRHRRRRRCCRRYHENVRVSM